jgi:hypothetical protein
MLVNDLSLVKNLNSHFRIHLFIQKVTASHRLIDGSSFDLSQYYLICMQNGLNSVMETKSFEISVR